MSERKVLNKYIPPDFDPDILLKKKKLLKKINKKKKKKSQNFLNIRMMYPFTLRCNKCKCFIYVGTKFNSKVEKLKDESYLNIPIWKFYGKCSDCKNEIIFKTDPKNGDYILISGGIRTYDANKEQEVADEYYRKNNEDKINNTEKESYNAFLELQRNEHLEELVNINKRNIDKTEIINKALINLYNKKEREENAGGFYMNILDSEDEKTLFNILNKNKTNEINNNIKNNINNKNEIIEEIESEKENNINENTLNNDSNIFSSRNVHLHNDDFNLKKKNILSNCNFIIKKNESLNMFNEYNSSDNLNESENEF